MRLSRAIFSSVVRVFLAPLGVRFLAAAFVLLRPGAFFLLLADVFAFFFAALAFAILTSKQAALL